MRLRVVHDVTTEEPPPRCGHWLGDEGRYCLNAEGVRRYLIGRRCPSHTPAALAGRPEPQPGPGYTPQAIPTPLGASARLDEQAIASGKRRSSPHDYRAAQAAVTARKEHTR